jgi:hypothetical protein
VEGGGLGSLAREKGQKAHPNRELKDLDPDEYIDPYCRVSVCDAVGSPSRQWEVLGQTEVVGNTDSPEWSTKICLTYFFEEQAIQPGHALDGANSTALFSKDSTSRCSTRTRRA